MKKDIEIFVDILKKKFPNHCFELNVGGDVVFVYGDCDDSVSWFCHNLSECMCKPVKRIMFIKPPSM